MKIRWSGRSNNNFSAIDILFSSIEHVSYLLLYNWSNQYLFVCNNIMWDMHWADFARERESQFTTARALK